MGNQHKKQDYLIMNILMAWFKSNTIKLKIIIVKHPNILFSSKAKLSMVQLHLHNSHLGIKKKKKRYARLVFQNHRNNNYYKITSD